ncbi:MAG: hypothetical protein MUC87_08165 [Bacteroidia bacterium]|jgi:hypothetical protein|nr:hypothetical protein [Bacteroidia bacterium]
MSAFKIIDKDYPILVTQIDTQKLQLADVEPHFRNLDEVLARHSGPFVVITLPNENPKSPPADVNKLINEKMIAMRERHKDRLKAEYIVISGLLAKLAYKSASIVIKSMKDTIVTESLQEAYNKGNQVLVKAAVPQV